MAEQEALGALLVAVSDLRREVGALTACMAQLVAGQEAHTALLQALLSAVTDLGEEGGGDGLAEALGRIADSLDEQGETLAGMRTGLDAIPAAVAATLGTARAA
ncbi:hypothetical protein [Methylobacterium sp. E-066]|uniref:hypothetical protein n=1 Tax=Methylobacterium sp. E-066 TaxID=2836584 RepID=UPI001FBB8589|nr:hypothetical protein [Methylobacterium sp. E-066]MCJ2139429.1 hypothetical protein [Methylobacterium sp. E-066]